MKRYLLCIVVAVLVGWPIWGDAASIKNDDGEVHLIKGRVTGKGRRGVEQWVYIEINPNGAKYFNCRFGCELVLEKTGSSVQLETDADVVIRHGVLEVK